MLNDTALPAVPGTPSAVERLCDFLRRSGLEPGIVYDFAALDAALGRPVRGCRGVLYRAIRVLQREERRTLVSVPNVGYRVAYARESPDLAQGRLERAQRQVRRGQQTLASTRLDELSPEERQRLNLHSMAIQALAHEMRAQRQRLGRLEGRLAEIEERPQLSPAEVEFLRQLMDQREG